MNNCIDCNTEFKPFPHNQKRCNPCTGLHYKKFYPQRYKRWLVSKFKPKVCKDCGENFAPDAPQQSYCKDCGPTRARSNILLRKYGITMTDYSRMLEQQDYSCAICNSDDPNNHANSGFFCVDHDHTTGEVRGLLCHHCNTGLGQFKDDISNMERAIDYIKTCNDHP